MTSNEILDKVTEILNGKPRDYLFYATVIYQEIDPLLIEADNGTHEEAYRLVRNHFNLSDEHMKWFNESTPSNRKRLEQRENPSLDSSKPHLTALFDGLVDIVADDNDQPAFLIKLQDGALEVSKHFDADGIHFVPPPARQIPWGLARASEVLQHFESYKQSSAETVNLQLFNDLVIYHRNLSELPDDSYYDLVAAFDLHTYCLEQFEYSPMLCLYAVPERGKSRTGKSIIYVCYRGLHVESLREAYIFRMSDRFRATFFFDVMSIWQKAEREGSEDILLQRFEKGSTVARVLYPDRGEFKDLHFFDVFGATLIATNEPPNRILETRALTINMPEGSKQFETDVSPDLALSLKERLTAFRAWLMGRALPEVEKPATGRLGDIVKPLLQMILLVNPEGEVRFRKLIGSIAEKRLVEKSETLEAEILKALVVLEKDVMNGALSVKTITNYVNSERSDRQKLTPQRIGRLLSALGFSKCRTHTGGSAVIWDLKLIYELMRKYGLEETSVRSESPESPRTKIQSGLSFSKPPMVPPPVPLNFGTPLPSLDKSNDDR